MMQLSQPRIARGRSTGVFALIIVAFILAYWLSVRVPANHIAWAKDLPAAMTQAQQRSLPLLLYFTADWCPPCRQMKREVWPDDAVQQLVNSSTIPLYIDVDEQSDLAQQYAVQSIPTLIIADASGRPLVDGASSVLMHIGSIDAAGLIDLIDRAVRLDGSIPPSAPPPPPRPEAGY